MRYNPAPHHSAVIDWLITRPYAAAWLDMGAGKTGSTATVIDRLLDQVDVSRVLIIGTPRIAAGVWFDEFAKWDHLNYLGTKSYHLTSEDIPVARVEVTRKGEKVKIMKLVNQRDSRWKILRRDAQVFTIHYDLVPRLAKLFGDEWPFDAVVMDESSMVSDQDTDRFRALRRVRGHVKRLYQLTGTPSSNGLEKLFSQVFLMDGGRRLGRTLTEFREKFMEPGTVDRRTGRVYKWQPRPFAREAIYQAVSDICLSLDPGDWGGLPERVINPIKVKLPAEARAIYEKVERDYIAQLQGGAVVEAATAAVLGNKLLQICNGAVYDEDHNTHIIHDEKLNMLQELIETTPGSILLAYWYNHDRMRIKNRFKGALDLKDDDDFEKKWCAGQVDLGMIQPASGGHGLNLQDGGSVAAWFGPIYNLELWLQFNKRLHRPGQKADRVVINVFVVEDSIEESVMDVLASKEDEQDALLLAVQRRVNKLTGKAE
jgi:SNF2 family DNA or RNA helicase